MSPGTCYKHVGGSCFTLLEATCSIADKYCRQRCLLDAQVLSAMLPGNMHRCISSMLAVAKDFVPLGTFCLLLVDKVKVINSMANSDALAITARQMFEAAFQIGQNGAAAPFVLNRFLNDHSMTEYHSKLSQAVADMHPVLFFGGKSDDYEQVVMKRNAVDGKLLFCLLHVTHWSSRGTSKPVCLKLVWCSRCA